MAKHLRNHGYGTLLMVMALDGLPVVNAQCLRYSVDMVPGPDCAFVGSASFAFGLNEIGELCGGYTPCSESANGASVWLGEGNWITPPRPPLSGQWWQRFSGINSSQVAVGTVVPIGMSTPQRAGAFDFVNGAYLDIGVPVGYTNAEAHAISESGTVCGYTSGPGLRAFIWERGQVTLLTLPFGPNSVANDISNNGLVCGRMGGSFWTASAFIWSERGTLDLRAVMPDAGGAEATGINNGGNVCGNSTYGDPGTQIIRRGFFWSKGAAQDLGMLPEFINCIPNAINDENMIVGHCTGEFAGSEAFVWTGGVMHSLQDLVPQELNLRIMNATDTNNVGQISAIGMLENGDTVALRLTPVPPLVADLNCDWQVNSLDLMEIIRNWGDCTPPPPPDDPTQAPPFAPPLCPADLNNDGRVNVPDLLMVINHWSP